MSQGDGKTFEMKYTRLIQRQGAWAGSKALPIADYKISNNQPSRMINVPTLALENSIETHINKRGITMIAKVMRSRWNQYA